LDPAVRGRVSVSERWGFEWDWLEMRGEVPAGGLVAAVPEGDDVARVRWLFGWAFSRPPSEAEGAAALES
jgi:hypothetical protein